MRRPIFERLAGVVKRSSGNILRSGRGAGGNSGIAGRSAATPSRRRSAAPSASSSARTPSCRRSLFNAFAADAFVPTFFEAAELVEMVCKARDIAKLNFVELSGDDDA
jgi:hypothetical protein